MLEDEEKFEVNEAPSESVAQEAFVEQEIVVEDVENMQQNVEQAPNADNQIEIASKLGADVKNFQNDVSTAPESDLVTVAPVEFSSFEDMQNVLSDDPKQNLDILQDVKMHITVELGRAKCSVKKILDFQKGSIVELNKVAGEQVELFANGKFVAYGEVIVIEDKFGLRVTSVAHKSKNN